MFRPPLAPRLVSWISRFALPRSRPRRRSKSLAVGGRSLSVEHLESRTLLSVTPLAPEEFKSFPFTASGGIVSDYVTGDYDIHVTGRVNLTKGTMAYQDVNTGTTNSAVLTGSGPFSAKKDGVPQGGGTWALFGNTDPIADKNGGQLSGSAVVKRTTTSPDVELSFDGTYQLANATLDTSNFRLNMDLQLVGGETTLPFRGFLQPTGNPFDVVVKPTWNDLDGTVNVNVQVLGRPHTTVAGQDRAFPVTKVQVYWAQGKTLKPGVLDEIPVYWNEKSGSYSVNIADPTNPYPAAPLGTTGLAFVTHYDGKTKVVTLPLPAVSVAAASATEDNAAGEIAIPVTLSKAFAKPVTVSFRTFKGPRDTAKPGIDFEAKSNSIVIPAGQTQGEIKVRIFDNGKFEPNKVFSVKLTGVVNARLNARQSQARATITDDDKPTISIESRSLAEGTPVGTQGRTTAFVFTVTLSNPSYQRITVNYATANGTAVTTGSPATGGRDYQAKTGVLTFNPGASLTRTITVVVNADATPEDPETFLVKLSRPTNANLGAIRQAIGTITDDDR